MTKRTTRDDFDRQQITRATYFTACRFLGRGKYDTRQAETLEEALSLREAMGAPERTVVYAVTPEGWSIAVDGIR